MKAASAFVVLRDLVAGVLVRVVESLAEIEKMIPESSIAKMIRCLNRPGFELSSVEFAFPRAGFALPLAGFVFHLAGFALP